MRVIQILSSTYWGGREQYALDISRGLDEAGTDVVAYTRDAYAVNEPFRRAGLRVRHLPLSGAADLPSALSLAAEFRRSPQRTVAHTHTTRDAFIAMCARKLSRRRDIRVVQTCHRIAPAPDTWWYRRVLRNLHALIFVSDMARDAFTSSWHPGSLPIAEERVHVLRNSVYLADKPDTALPEKGPVIAAYYGPVVPGKGVATLIEALPALRGMRTRLCVAGPGDPDYIDSLKRLAVRHGVMDMVDWCGTSLTPEQVMGRACLGVLPSMEPEAFGGANALFMAWGRPQITTFNGGQVEYLRPGREALLVPPSNVSALSEALVRLSGDAPLRAAMGAAALARFRQVLSWPLFQGRLTDIYAAP